MKRNYRDDAPALTEQESIQAVALFRDLADATRKGRLGRVRAAVEGLRQLGFEVQLARFLGGGKSEDCARDEGEAAHAS